MAKARRKALLAKDVVKDPTLVDLEPGRHLLIYDRSTSQSFAQMLDALDLLVARGWRVAGLSTNEVSSGIHVEMYALLQREPSAGDGTPWPYEP